MRGHSAEVLHATGCTNDECLAVGRLARSEAEAITKWDARNLNLTIRACQK